MTHLLFHSPSCFRALSGCRLSITISSATSQFSTTTSRMSKHERSASQDDVLRHPSTKVAKKVDENAPMDQLARILDDQKSSQPVRNVLHWFRSKDIRAEDNKGLSAASQKAKEGKGALLTCYLLSPQDLEWHGTSPARTDLILSSLKILKDQLQKLNIPLAIVTADERGDKADRIMDFIRKHDISHVFGNLEYEVDELRRDIKIAKRISETKDISIDLLHDQTVVQPLMIHGGSGPMKVFTPYHKAWLAEVKSSPELLDLAASPEANDTSVAKHFKDLFDTAVPDISDLPSNKHFASDEEASRIRKLWPPGHEAGMKRLRHFLHDKVAAYAATRSDPAADSSSRMSAYFSAGIVSVREACAEAKKVNKGANFDDSGDPGIASWVREIVFREFYRHMMVLKPHGGMNLPQNLKFNNVKWEDDEEGWYKWCEGKTGMPLVDAGMRQLNHEAYMHNRARMNTSSYLSANLLLDYRRGERYFAEHLIDWDLSNNTNGWEPSYTVFNPVTQAENNDKTGEYIRRWVPELKDVKGKAVFSPHDRLSKEEFAKLGYPSPHVDFNETKARAVERYKRDLHSAPDP